MISWDIMVISIGEQHISKAVIGLKWEASDLRSNHSFGKLRSVH